MEAITIQISAADKAMLKRIAKSVDRRPADLNQLIFARGLEIFFCDMDVWIEKLPDEYTEEERQQQEKNKAIRGNPEINGWDAQQKAGYVQVRDSLTNHQRKPDGEGFQDPLIEPIAKRLRAIATD